MAEIVASSSAATVKNAPFSAEAVSESVQILADGNRITRNVTTRMYRDSEGRFRREEIPGPGGAVGSIVGLQQTISISDPVAGVRYYLNPGSKIARTTNITGTTFITTTPTAVGGAANSAKAVIVNPEALTRVDRVQLESTAIQKLNITPTTIVTPAISTSADNRKVESLGVRNIEGVEAEGTRTTTTIAAGAIGNERPIEIVYERWYSKDLQLIVLSKHSDPRFGEQTYRLTNINRNEPDRSLFTPSSDYKIVTEQRLSPTSRKQ
jgi:hypothetical protein